MKVSFFLMLGLATSALSANAALHAFYDNDYCGFKNDKGSIVIPANQYESCGQFSEGLAHIGVSNSMTADYSDLKAYQGFIDETGQIIIPTEHEVGQYGPMRFDFRDFHQGLVAVYRSDEKGNGKYGYMDKSRNLTIPYQYDSAEDFHDGLAVVSKNDKYGTIDKNGKTVIPITIDNLASYSEGLAAYAVKNHWNDDYIYGFLDPSGAVKIAPKWNAVNKFSEGLAVVSLGSSNDQKWGVIDKTGNYVVKPQYDEVYINYDFDSCDDSIDFEDIIYKNNKVFMYNYTNPNQIEGSSITRYTLNHKGQVTERKLFKNWQAIIENQDYSQ